MSKSSKWAFAVAAGLVIGLTAVAARGDALDLAPALDPGASPHPASRTMLRCYQHGRMILETPANAERLKSVRGFKGPEIPVGAHGSVRIIDLVTAVCLIERHG